MLALIPQLAAAEAFSEIIRRANQGLSLSTPELLLALLAGSLLALALFIWVYLRFRKKRQKAEASDFRRMTSPSKEKSDEGDGSQRRRKRHRRRAHRPRNPSLQQTGGLPPPRPEDEPPKY